MTIKELQDWVRQDWEKYHDTMPSVKLQLLYVIEELGEVAEAIRKADNEKKDRDEKVHKDSKIGPEMGDLLVSLVTLANSFGVDLTREVKGFQARLEERR